MTEFLDALHQPHTQLLLRLVVGGLLLLAGVTKLAERSAAQQAVSEYDILPERFVRPFAATLPWVETGLGVLLLVGLGTTAAAALAVPLFLSFAIAIGVNLGRGRDFDCHCFGSVQSERIGWPSLLRSLALATAALAVAAGTSQFGALEAVFFNVSADLPPAVEVIPVVLMAAVVFNVLILLPEAITFQAIAAQRQRTMVSGRAQTNGHHPASPVEVQNLT